MFSVEYNAEDPGKVSQESVGNLFLQREELKGLEWLAKSPNKKKTNNERRGKRAGTV